MNWTKKGVAAISHYDGVVTGSHPEYHTGKTLDALTQYRDNGGALLLPWRERLLLADSAS